MLEHSDQWVKRLAMLILIQYKVPFMLMMLTPSTMVIEMEG